MRTDFFENYGKLQLRNNFNLNVGLVKSETSNDPGDGAVYIYDDAGIKRAGMDIDSNNMGILFADVKNFRINHPLDESKEIWYAAIEGPEVAVYERGTANLIEGSAFVSFSEHFGSIINVEKYTVMITPLFDQTYGLAVIKKSANGFQVKELMSGRNSFSFDYEIKAIRKGHEDFQVVRDKN